MVNVICYEIVKSVGHSVALALDDAFAEPDVAHSH